MKAVIQENPEQKITTDIEQFDLHLKAAERHRKPEKNHELRKVELYKGPVFMRISWLNDIVSQYEVRTSAANALMRELAKQKTMRVSYSTPRT